MPRGRAHRGLGHLLRGGVCGGHPRRLLLVSGDEATPSGRKAELLPDFVECPGQGFAQVFGGDGAHAVLDLSGADDEGDPPHEGESVGVVQDGHAGAKGGDFLGQVCCLEATGDLQGFEGFGCEVAGVEAVHPGVGVAGLAAP